MADVSGNPLSPSTPDREGGQAAGQNLKGRSAGGAPRGGQKFASR
ncbi:hypothetical protein [Hyphomonas sp.]